MFPYFPNEIRTRRQQQGAWRGPQWHCQRASLCLRGALGEVRLSRLCQQDELQLHWFFQEMRRNSIWNLWNAYLSFVVDKHGKDVSFAVRFWKHSWNSLKRHFLLFILHCSSTMARPNIASVWHESLMSHSSTLQHNLGRFWSAERFAAQETATLTFDTATDSLPLIILDSRFKVNSAAILTFNSSNRWLGVRVELLGCECKGTLRTSEGLSDGRHGV